MISLFFLAIIQGIAEFLPISSSAHLIIFRDVFLVGKDVLNNNLELTFDIALHFGTLLAIVVFFYNDILNIIKSDRKVINNLLVATIPAAIMGFIFEDIIERVVRSNYYLIVFSLFIMGIAIYYIDIKSKQNKTIKSMNLKDSLVIGFFQIFALIPGFSRSGTTIVGGRLLKINREDSTRFSFYLSIPIVSGALLLKILKTDYTVLGQNLSLFIIGIITSFIVGLLCIKLLIKYVKTNNFKIFMWYRIIFGFIILLYLINH